MSGTLAAVSMLQREDTPLTRLLAWGNNIYQIKFLFSISLQYTQ
jgi:hypothetical protein